MKKEVKCDCGARIARAPICSDWCSTQQKHEEPEESLDDIFDVRFAIDTGTSFEPALDYSLHIDLDDEEEII